MSLYPSESPVSLIPHPRKGSYGRHSIANQEKRLPRDFISADGFHITPQCRTYLTPLIQGEGFPPFRNGLPDYVTLKNQAVPKKLHSDFQL
jgi:ATP-dependent phosphofructokinase / diphosphate-dependent phosphofructokinase